MEKPKLKEKETGNMVAIVRVRGTVNLNPATNSAMQHMKLLAKNNCVIHADSPWLRGVLTRCKDHVTFGPISQELITKLNATKFAKNGMYTLPPPRKGYGRKGIKKSFVEGGALGDRGDKINDLIMRMI